MPPSEVPTPLAGAEQIAPVVLQCYHKQGQGAAQVSNQTSRENAWTAEMKHMLGQEIIQLALQSVWPDPQ